MHNTTVRSLVYRCVQKAESLFIQFIVGEKEKKRGTERERERKGFAISIRNESYLSEVSERAKFTNEKRVHTPLNSAHFSFLSLFLPLLQSKAFNNNYFSSCAFSVKDLFAGERHSLKELKAANRVS